VCVCVCVCERERERVYVYVYIPRIRFQLLHILPALPLDIGMGWLQLVGSIKLQVSFAKEIYKRDYSLQRRPIILSILLTVATLYIHVFGYEKKERDVNTCVWV